VSEQPSYPDAAVEQATEVQEVILRAMAGRRKWYEAAEILGLSDRQMRRVKQFYGRQRYNGLCDRQPYQPSPKRVPVAVVQQVLTLCRDRHTACNLLHFHGALGQIPS
jgi:hypothetical protein